MPGTFFSWIKGYRLSLITVGVFAVLALAGFHIRDSTDRFARAYREYAVVANLADTSAFIPGAVNNPVRIQVNTILTQVLADKMIDARRLELSKQGLDILTYSQKQIDAINAKLDASDAAVAEMNASADFVSDMFSKGLPDKIVGLARERHDAISDIRAYSYRADAATQKIFEHLIMSKGVLSNAYVTELNNEIPAEEGNFNKRTNRYNDLQDIGNEIQQDFTEFSKRFSIPKSSE